MMIAPSAVSLRMTTSWLASAGSMAMSAWGTSISRNDCVGRSPTASAASRCPRGRLCTPDRMSSAKTDPL